MNQILDTKKIFVTPELKRKKILYKGYFFLSVFFVCLLSSFYIYAEYDRNKAEQVSKDILSNLEVGTNIQNDKVLELKGDIIKIELDDTTQKKITFSNFEEAEINQQSNLNNTNNIVKAKDGLEYTTIATINIPKINLKYPILSETTDELLKIAPTKFWGSNPNEVGNFCIVGHNYRNDKFFSKVPILENGDIIEITDMAYNTTLKYAVYDKYEVVPEDLKGTSQLTNGRKEITLITCTNDNLKRVIVKARQV